MSRKIVTKAEGKHIGHACEGHFRGLVQRAIAGTAFTLARELPFAFHVNPDVVVLDKEGRVHTVVIVAFWNDSKSSEKKFYRSRSEYSGVQSAISLHPDRFVAHPLVSVVLYGAQGGWKEQILADLRNQCSPCFYIPDALSPTEANQIVAVAYGEYKPHWESGKSASREHVEAVTAAKPALSGPEQKVLRLIQEHLVLRSGAKSGRSKSAAASTRIVRLPSGPINTRYRQALGLLSVFSDDEIKAWKASGKSIISPGLVSDYSLRAHFLGLGSIVERKGVGRKETGRTLTVFVPADPIRTVAGRTDYAPDLLDFKNWEEIPESTLLKTISAHRELTRNPGPVFKGGAFDQCIGNWRGICANFISHLPALVKSLKANDLEQAKTALLLGGPVGPEPWHPASGQAQFYPSWALAASIAAGLKNDRAIRSDFDSRSQIEPSSKQGRLLARELMRLPDSIRILEETIGYCKCMLSADLAPVADKAIPDPLSKDNPCSLLKDFYNTLTTNSSHNPLCAPVRTWLETKHPGFAWSGWPSKRSVSIADALGVKEGRRQWQFVGISSDKSTAIAAEVKSITANNWGNKSKELYDRVAETRRAAWTADVNVICIGVLDGDFGSDEFAELGTGIGYDEVYSIKEVLGVP
jgi:hypothetical protein